MVQLMLDYGADVNAKCTPSEPSTHYQLFFARNSANVTRLLIKHSANPHVISSYDWRDSYMHYIEAGCPPQPEAGANSFIAFQFFVEVDCNLTELASDFRVSSCIVNLSHKSLSCFFNTLLHTRFVQNMMKILGDHLLNS